MANEPINIFSAHADPAGVLNRLRERFPDAEVEADGDTWKAVTVRFGEGERAAALTFLHDRDYYAGPDWPRQKAGMQGYFDRFPAGDRKPRLMATIGSLQFALATRFEPDFDPDGDDRLTVVFDIAEFLDGVLFTPSALRDAAGRILVGADGEYDEDAVWPRVGLVVEVPPRSEGGEADEGDQPTPPDPDRVARRAVALTGVVARAVIEREVKFGGASDEDAARMHARLLGWLREVGIEDELEPAEQDVIARPPGQLQDQEFVNAMWRVEGLAVLAWALGRLDLPRYDELSDVDAVWDAVGFLKPDEVRSMLAIPTVRPPAELEALRKQMLGYHWRLRDFRWSRPQAMDFRAFAKDCWFGSFDLSPFSLIDDDLALRGQRIDAAPPEVFDTCCSIAAERHLAINWLCAGPEEYSEADVST